jgi:hypothetical protein
VLEGPHAPDEPSKSVVHSEPLTRAAVTPGQGWRPFPFRPREMFRTDCRRAFSWGERFPPDR